MKWPGGAAGNYLPNVRHVVVHFALIFRTAAPDRTAFRATTSHGVNATALTSTDSVKQREREREIEREIFKKYSLKRVIGTGLVWKQFSAVLSP